MKMHFPDRMLGFTGKSGYADGRWDALIRSNRFTLGGLYLAGLGLPWLGHVVNQYGHIERPPMTLVEILTLVVCGLALTGAHVALRQVSMLAFAADKALVLPAFLGNYFVFFSAASLLRLPFLRYVAVASFVCAIVWYFAVVMLRSRSGMPRLAFVGGMPRDPLLAGAQIDWTVLSTSDLAGEISGVVFDKSQPMSPHAEKLLGKAVLNGLPVYEASDFSEMLSGRVSLATHPIEYFGLLMPSRPLLRVKRLADLVVVIPGIVLALPVIALASLLIRLESPGAALFRQPRMGYKGEVFVCYKLRSMRSDVPGPAFTEAEDPRITRVGRFIRKWRIDELPQLFNVLRGDMSFIGPRPEAVSLATMYQAEIPYYAYRHSVRPGITGWAAVNQGNVALADEARRKLEYDFYYIKHCSVWLDILVILLTVRTVLTGFGSR